MNVPKVLTWIVILILLYAAIYTTMCFAFPRIFKVDFQLWSFLPGGEPMVCSFAR